MFWNRYCLMHIWLLKMFDANVITVEFMSGIELPLVVHLVCVDFMQNNF